MLALVLFCMVGVASLSWSGFTWTIRPDSASSGPGPNKWSSSNVVVDGSGILHLKLTKDSGKWACAELYTTTRQGFGTYQWLIEGPVSALEPSIVLGLFPYTTPDLGPDGTNEIDIEFSQWNQSTGTRLSFTTYPSNTQGNHRSKSFLSLNGASLVTCRFSWNASQINYQVMSGFQPIGTTSNVLAQWVDAPSQSNVNIPQQPLPTHMNLWLFEGIAPVSSLDILVHRFDYKQSIYDVNEIDSEESVEDPGLVSNGFSGESNESDEASSEE